VLHNGFLLFFCCGTKAVGTVIVGRDNHCCRRVVVLHNGFLLFFVAAQRPLAQSLLDATITAAGGLWCCTMGFCFFFAAAQLLLPQLLLPQLLLPQLVPCHCTRPTDHSTRSLSTRTKKKSGIAQVQPMHI